MKYIFFDFDGTISNTRDGVCDILKKTFDKYGVDVDESLYSRFIGPPLSETFEKYIGADKAYEAVKFFRELYVGEKAIYKSKLYDGVADMLKSCHDMDGIVTGVATCKKHEEADHLLEWFGVRESIEILSGLVYNVRETKTQVLQYALDKYGIDAKDCVMVGDTIYDVVGAEEVGMDCILCLWGFGDYENINNKNVVYRANTPDEVTEFVKNNYAIKAR
ncbi:MAG: HAD hydrolase-like protein [Clostridia bacterium]|nr:HAD hydrolase-like protein [Clostridia bacterium]MDE7329382.1 HAD hydrolase-like protein [Clostridia bacterium]